MNLHQSFGLPDPRAFGQMLHDRDDFLLRQMRSVEGRPFAFGEADATGKALQKPKGFGGSVTTMNDKVGSSPCAMIGTLGVLAAKPRKIVHARSRLMKSVETDRKPRQASSLQHRTTIRQLV